LEYDNKPSHEPPMLLDMLRPLSRLSTTINYVLLTAETLPLPPPIQSVHLKPDGLR
ncbi:hypothetical protein BgiMline_031750, partial [Biomphalaria glabrata]